MLIADYKKLVDLKQLWEQTDVYNIKSNIRKMIEKNEMKNRDLCDILGISIHTANTYTSVSVRNNKPDIYTLLTLAEYWQIDVENLMQDDDTVEAETPVKQTASLNLEQINFLAKTLECSTEEITQTNESNIAMRQFYSTVLQENNFL